MPTDQEWEEGLAKWQKAVAERDERIRGLKQEVSRLGNRARYLEDRLGVLETFAKLLLLEAALPRNNKELLQKVAALLPGFQQAVNLLREDGVDEILNKIIPLPPLEEAAEPPKK